MDFDLEDLLKKGITRKEFLEVLFHHCILILWFSKTFHPFCALASAASEKSSKTGKISLIEARYYRRLEGKEVQCLLCPHKCIVAEGHRGECGVRENRGGNYYALTFGRPCALHVDPIEKKPLFHVLPGSRAFSLATAGCNLSCLFCQNWQISQALPEEVPYEEMSPDEVVRKAVDMNCPVIAYTYSEPTIFFEYMLAIAKKAHDKGLINTCHTNGYINREPLAELLQVMDAANIDLKGFSKEYYAEICGGELEPVLDSLKQMKQKGLHIELTNLVIPSKNDHAEKIRKMCQWIKKELGSDVPIHFSRFYPQYKLQNLPPTPVETLERARGIAMEEGLDYVYIGNVRPGHEAENTYCPKCHKLVIERRGYTVTRMELKRGECLHCGQKIPGRWG